MCSFICMGFRAFGEGSVHLIEYQRSSSIWLTSWLWPIVYAHIELWQSLGSHAKTYGGQQWAQCIAGI